MKIAQIFLVIFFTFCAVAQADDVLDSLERAKKLYQDGSYSKAVSELQFAVGLIKDKQVDRYRFILPDPPTGWTADQAQISKGGGMGLVTGISVSRTYHGSQGQNVRVEAVTDSPLISGLAMILENPMLLGNNRVVMVNGEKAIEEWNQSDGSGKLQVMIQNRVLVTISGSSLKSKDLLYEFAKRIDFKKIRKMLQE